MSNLKYLLLYRERLNLSGVENIEFAADNFGVLAKEDARMCLLYMSSGLTLFEFVSPIFDPISGEGVENKVVTDGCFVWDALLMFWISKYRVALPAEFISHIQLTRSICVDKLAEDRHKLMANFKNAQLIFMYRRAASSLKCNTPMGISGPHP